MRFALLALLLSACTMTGATEPLRPNAGEGGVKRLGPYTAVAGPGATCGGVNGCP